MYNLFNQHADGVFFGEQQQTPCISVRGESTDAEYPNRVQNETSSERQKAKHSRKRNNGPVMGCPEHERKAKKGCDESTDAA